MNNAAKVGIAGVCTAVLTLGGFGAYNVVHGLTKNTPTAAQATAQSTEPPSAEQAVKLARAFLDTWAAQHFDGAGSDTDAPDRTSQALKDYADSLHLTKLSFDQVAAAGPATVLVENDATKVTFQATVQLPGGSWTYDGSLAVIRSGGGQNAVHWGSSVLYPGLKDGQSLTAGQLPPGASTAKVVASDGKTDLSKFPSLTDIVATIRQHGGEGTGGSNGTGVAIVGSDGNAVKTLKVFTTGKAPVIRTTIDPGLQTVAERAVKDAHLQGKPAGTVALDWNTGHILAIAYANTGGDGNIAINGIKSPGSTMKIITSAALFDMAGMTPESVSKCDSSATVWGQTFHNDAGVTTNPTATLLDSFRQSCNTAFIHAGFGKLVRSGDASALHREAVNVFGMGSWSIGGGVETTDPSIPPDVQGGDQGAQFIGQGKVTATPLFLASVAATVRAEGFHQPIILPGQHQDTAPQQISRRTAGYLQSMMRTVATSGTAAPRLAGLSGVGAKTGTAEEGTHTNGWLTAYDKDIAVAALVEGGSSGVDSAGYVVRHLLTRN